MGKYLPNVGTPCLELGDLFVLLKLEEFSSQASRSGGRILVEQDHVFFLKLSLFVASRPEYSSEEYWTHPERGANVLHGIFVLFSAPKRELFRVAQGLIGSFGTRNFTFEGCSGHSKWIGTFLVKLRKLLTCKTFADQTQICWKFRISRCVLRNVIWSPFAFAWREE